MSRKVLCPFCGTTNHPGYRLAARCTTCRKRLPLTVPRSYVYTARTLARPLLVIMLLITAFYLAPQFKSYRETLSVQKAVTKP